MADYYQNLGRNLMGTKTFDNLLAAFAGESEARNKYTYFASKAKSDGYVQISKIFEETAANSAGRTIKISIAVDENLPPPVLNNMPEPDRTNLAGAMETFKASDATKIND